MASSGPTSPGDNDDDINDDHDDDDDDVLTSRCTWKANETAADLKAMTQGPHTLDKP